MDITKTTNREIKYIGEYKTIISYNKQYANIKIIGKSGLINVTDIVVTNKLLEKNDKFDIKELSNLIIEKVINLHSNNYVTNSKEVEQ